jgi:hypothetical protein
MSDKPSYLAAAFNARPLGMPIPPNWFALAAIGLLGAFVNPGIWLIGAGLEGFYLWTLARNRRFRAVVDATHGKGDAGQWETRYDSIVAGLDDAARKSHDAIQHQAGELTEILTRSGANPSQLDDVRRMVWLHLRLLAARAAFTQVTGISARERTELDEQAARLAARIDRAEAESELRRSLEQQLAVIESRRAAHGDAARRCELVDAELERLRQQIALVREQALLATDEASIAPSLDALAASLNEANRWLKDQRELFAGLDDLTDEPPPADLLRPRARRSQRSAMEESA